MSSRPTTILALLALSGCQSSPAPGDAAPPPLTAVASASATIAPAPPRPPLIDLLYRTKARVAVTSNVKNPKDYPEHLIDRRPETAWNSETGDLGARVLFRVPPSARVQRILVTVGYDKVNKDGDLFFMNHRVAQVEISREGQSLGTFDLHPERREPQAIELDQQGGTFEIRPTRTVPGTRDAWREIVISELVVLGAAPEEEQLAPAMPQVTIGTLDRVMVDSGPLQAVRAGAPYPDVQAFCAAHLRAERQLIGRIHEKDKSFHLDEIEPYCGARKDRPVIRKALSAPFTNLVVLSLLEGREMVDRLAIVTTRGLFPSPITLSMEYPGPGCGMTSSYAIDSATVETTGKGSPALVLRITKYAAYLMTSPENFESAAGFVAACVLDAAGVPACREELVSSFEGDGGWTWRMRETQRWDPHPSRWNWKREPSIDEDGQIRLSPCVDDSGRAASCSRRNADLLRRF